MDSRKIKLFKNWYNEDGDNIFKKTSITIDKGLNILVGCNGSGKTTLINQIKNELKKENIPFLHHDNYTNDAKNMRNEALFTQNYGFIASSLISSEGENITNIFREIAKKIGAMIKSNSDSKEFWIILDAIDSGLSIDNVLDFKDFIQFVIDEEKHNDIFFIVSANEYEFAKDEKCIDVNNCRYIKFNSYDDYREFIICSRELKDSRGSVEDA